MTDRLQLAAVIDRLIYGNDTAFDAEDARAEAVRRNFGGISTIFGACFGRYHTTGPVAPIVWAALSRGGGPVSIVKCGEDRLRLAFTNGAVSLWEGDDHEDSQISVCSRRCYRRTGDIRHFWRGIRPITSGEDLRV